MASTSIASASMASYGTLDSSSIAQMTPETLDQFMSNKFFEEKVQPYHDNDDDDDVMYHRREKLDELY